MQEILCLTKKKKDFISFIAVTLDIAIHAKTVALMTGNMIGVHYKWLSDDAQKACGQIYIINK